MRPLSKPDSRSDWGRFAADPQVLLNLFDEAPPRPGDRWREPFGLVSAQRRARLRERPVRTCG